MMYSNSKQSYPFLFVVLLAACCLSIYNVVSAALPPSNLVMYTIDQQTFTTFNMTVINITSGVVNSTTLPILQNNMWFGRFLGVDNNDNLIILIGNNKGANALATISQSGKLLNDPVNRNAVYLVVGSGPQLYVYDFANSSTDDIQLTIPDQQSTTSPTGCFDGVDNYYFMQADNTFSQFLLSSYSFSDQKQHDTLNVTGIAPNSLTYLFSANKQVYVLGYNLSQTTDMSLYLLDTDQATATLSYSDQNTGLAIGLSSYVWFSDNYFVYLSMSSSSSTNQYYLTTVDLNTNQVISHSQVQGTFNTNPNISGVY
ncbi:hypothetical protein DFA_08745 [Cavenderia fasciculata]|uniref:Uncharacterized protein n=1 Tax=Cavenderia fasciculata TaxID=261658 RepID=F4Q3Z0_CACFS|nr:uncharacterized protein DFA_08745 [Cavenderia fasciculata]EGG17746.1 hypothetical protein DFA_08745 [Cavenderia fasciculata]|eukprot:XP_004356230.1 hypothetical protein DFA_08745 [Cavenderia fasciculata]